MFLLSFISFCYLFVLVVVCCSFFVFFLFSDVIFCSFFVLFLLSVLFFVVFFCSLLFSFVVCCYFLLYFTPLNLWFSIKLNSNHFVQFQFSPVQFNSMQFNSMQTLMRSHSMCSPVCIYTQPCVCIHAALYVYTHSVVRIYTQPCVYIGFKI